jgi:hypothetical protein
MAGYSFYYIQMNGLSVYSTKFYVKSIFKKNWWHSYHFFGHVKYRCNLMEEPPIF